MSRQDRLVQLLIFHKGNPCRLTNYPSSELPDEDADVSLIKPDKPLKKCPTMVSALGRFLMLFHEFFGRERQGPHLFVGYLWPPRLLWS